MNLLPGRARRMLLATAIVIGGVFLSTRTGSSQPILSRFVGSWQGTVAAVNPPGLPPFTSLITFFNDGNVIESRRLYVAASPFGPMFETPSHGGWVRTGGNDFDVSFMFLLQRAADGSDVGTDNIRLHLHLDAIRNRLTGTLVSTIKDSAGNTLFSASGNYDATPVP